MYRLVLSGSESYFYVVKIHVFVSYNRWMEKVFFFCEEEIVLEEL